MDFGFLSLLVAAYLLPASGFFLALNRNKKDQIWNQNFGYLGQTLVLVFETGASTYISFLLREIWRHSGSLNSDRRNR